MVWITLLGILSYWWVLPSSFLCVVIHKYVNCKPPGRQSVLDLLIKDYLIVCITRNITVVFVQYLGLLYGQVEATLAQVIVLVATNLGGIEIAFVQVLLLAKYLLIFEANWLVDRLDSEVIWASRILVLLYSGFRFIIDFFGPINTYHTLSLLTGTESKT